MRPEGPRLQRLLERTRTAARRLASRLPPASSVDVNDLYQEGVVGLLEACDRYDPGQGASLETYAFARVRGAMIDLLRRVSWAGRGWLRGHKADVLMLSLEAPQARVSGAVFCEDEEGPSLGATLPSNEPDPQELVELWGLLQGLPQALALLPARERHVFELKHIGGRSDKEIALLMHVTPSRITQLRHQAYARIRDSLTYMPADSSYDDLQDPDDGPTAGLDFSGGGYPDHGPATARVRFAKGG